MRNFEKHENTSKCINTPEKSLKYSQAGIKLNNTRNDRVQYTFNQPKRAHLSTFTHNPLNPNTKKLNSHLFLQKYWGKVVEVFQSRFIFCDHVFNSHYHAVL